MLDDVSGISHGASPDGPQHFSLPSLTTPCDLRLCSPERRKLPRDIASMGFQARLAAAADPPTIPVERLEADVREALEQNSRATNEVAEMKVAEDVAVAIAEAVELRRRLELTEQIVEELRQQLQEEQLLRQRETEDLRQEKRKTEEEKQRLEGVVDVFLRTQASTPSTHRSHTPDGKVMRRQLSQPCTRSALGATLAVPSAIAIANARLASTNASDDSYGPPAVASVSSRGTAVMPRGAVLPVLGGPTTRATLPLTVLAGQRALAIPSALATPRLDSPRATPPLTSRSVAAPVGAQRTRSTSPGAPAVALRGPITVSSRSPCIQTRATAPVPRNGPWLPGTPTLACNVRNTLVSPHFAPRPLVTAAQLPLLPLQQLPGASSGLVNSRLVTRRPPAWVSPRSPLGTTRQAA